MRISKSELIQSWLTTFPTQQQQDDIISLFIQFKDGKADTQAQIRNILSTLSLQEILAIHSNGTKAYIKQSDSDHQGIWGEIVTPL